MLLIMIFIIIIIIIIVKHYILCKLLNINTWCKLTLTNLTIINLVYKF